MALIYGLVGLSIGSFLNNVIDRVPAGKSLIRPPSHCPACQHVLGPLDLIPVLSFVILRGRCRYCGEQIPWRLPIVELASGALFVLLWHHYGPTLELAFATVYAAVFIALFSTDVERQVIPNKIVYPALIFALVSAPFTPERAPLRAVAAGLLGFGLLLAIALVQPGGMGMGDVKLAGFLGLALGFPETAVALFLAIALGGLIAGGAVLAGLKSRKDRIPFGPFLTTGGLIAMLYGEKMWQWYLTLVR